MKSKVTLIIGTMSVAAWMTAGAALAQSSGSGKQTIHPDVSGSKGGSQSERTGESGVPLPKGSPQSGTVEMGKSSGGRSDMATRNGSTGNVKTVQQALKDKGHDPGPIDGVMGAKTKEALKEFQTASNLKPTGTLNSQTAEKLGVQANASSSGNSRGTSKSSDTTTGKDSDQPNQTPMKNR